MYRYCLRAMLFLFAAASAFGQAQVGQAQIATPNAPATVRSAYGQKLKIAGLPNGGRVNEVLYRGAQPHTEGMEALKKMGVTTIVDLRGENAGLRESEKKEAESLGMRFVNIPVSGWAPPSNTQVAQFLTLFRDPKERVFVHCRFGDDRTGVFIAAYRMAYDGWPSQQAMNEMYFFGFNGFWHPSMKSFIRDFPALLKTAPALTEYARHDEPSRNGASQ